MSYMSSISPSNRNTPHRHRSSTDRSTFSRAYLVRNLFRPRHRQFLSPGSRLWYIRSSADGPVPSGHRPWASQVWPQEPVQSHLQPPQRERVHPPHCWAAWGYHSSHIASISACSCVHILHTPTVQGRLGRRLNQDLLLPVTSRILCQH